MTDVCRFAGGVWFFFALIMIASYTANLAAFLTVETLETPIKSVEDLPGQDEIWYGAMEGGSTAGFFENSNNDVYQKIWQFMSGRWPSAVVYSLTLAWQVCTRQRSCSRETLKVWRKWRNLMGSMHSSWSQPAFSTWWRGGASCLR